MVYEEGDCGPAYFELRGSDWSLAAGLHTLLRAGSLGSSGPFAVSMNGSSFKEVTETRGTGFCA